MSEPIITELPKAQTKIEFTVSPEEAKPYLDEAVKDISTAKPIAGFRPGKAGYEDVKRAYGEMQIWETALERIVRAFYVRTILEKQIDTVGSPEVSVDQLTPGQPIKFTVIAPVSPRVTQFADLSACKVKTKDIKIEDAQVNDAIEEMQKMRRSEVLADRPATTDDLVIIDLEMRKDHVLLEGGSGKDYRVYLGEEHYIPGFTKQLEGIKAGEERIFNLALPKEHYQKQLAGQEVEFTAKAKSVFALQIPEANDEFAKGVGIESMQKLREKIKENLELESKQRADESAEISMLEKLVDASKFSDVPDLLVNEEVRRMVHELEHGVEDQGMKWEEYLSSIKKTPDELKLDFAQPAIRRIQTAVLIKEIAKRENISVTNEELDKEIDRILSGVRESDKETRERVASPEYRDYIAIQLRNRKTLEWLKGKCIET
ncbi:MAG TPA: trigger factor [Patescibacteria group bacterium]|nr:trigger factor [Patescibacteria group bacterium]